MTDFTELSIAGRVATPGDVDWDEARARLEPAPPTSSPSAVAFVESAEDVAATVRFADAQRPQGRRPGHRPRRRPAGPARGHDPDQDRAHARDRDRLRGADGAGRGRRAGARAERGRAGPRPLLDARLRARRRRRRLHARRRAELARSPPRLRLQPRAARSSWSTPTARRARSTPTTTPDLFWALRGGGGGYAIVTALHLDLLPIAELYAGALLFPAEVGADAIRAYRDWVADGARRGHLDRPLPAPRRRSPTCPSRSAACRC